MFDELVSEIEQELKAKRLNLEEFKDDGYLKGLSEKEKEEVRKWDCKRSDLRPAIKF